MPFHSASGCASMARIAFTSSHFLPPYHGQVLPLRTCPRRNFLRALPLKGGDAWQEGGFASAPRSRRRRHLRQGDRACGSAGQTQRGPDGHRACGTRGACGGCGDLGALSGAAPPRLTRRAEEGLPCSRVSVHRRAAAGRLGCAEQTRWPLRGTAGSHAAAWGRG